MLVVCLHSNIFDEHETKRTRGEAFEASQGFVDMVLAGDAKAGRDPRLAVIPDDLVRRKPGRPRKAADEAA